jgi:hypothetical protein
MHEARITQHAQVPADCRAPDRKRVGEFPDRAWALCELFHDASTHRVAQRVEHTIKQQLVTHE